MSDWVEWAVMWTTPITGEVRFGVEPNLEAAKQVAYSERAEPVFTVVGREVGPWRYVRLDDGRLGLPVGNDG